ncbi:hypothetical protein [Microbispora hainanensis]|uniref:Uncharacterized protein n=1 Tax=Microbispora hainanensis TaxID=568844 RepID=A0A544YY51_9ACTN|nr:hypothetical protein [Microbispora hainanensis]TQS21681.1 hypothetical protein FLX08_10790 [Microbispora hainanensis]
MDRIRILARQGRCPRQRAQAGPQRLRLSLVSTVRNDDDQPLNVWTSSHDYSRVYAEASTSAAAIVSGRYRYRPLRDSVHNVTLGPYLFVTSQDEYVVADDRTAYATR